MGFWGSGSFWVVSVLRDVHRACGLRGLVETTCTFFCEGFVGGRGFGPYKKGHSVDGFRVSGFRAYGLRVQGLKVERFRGLGFCRVYGVRV